MFFRVGLDLGVHLPHSLRCGLNQAAINDASLVMLRKQSRHKHASGLDPYIHHVEEFNIFIDRSRCVLDSPVT